MIKGLDRFRDDKKWAQYCAVTREMLIIAGEIMEAAQEGRAVEFPPGWDMLRYIKAAPGAAEFLNETVGLLLEAATIENPHGVALPSRLQ